MRHPLIFLPIILLSSCATPPDRIAPAPVPVGTYAALDCKQLEVEHHRVIGLLSASSDAQNQAATGDAVSVLLIGVPVSSAVGTSREAQVAAYKGQADELGQERIRKGCFA